MFRPALSSQRRGFHAEARIKGAGFFVYMDIYG